MSQIPILYDLQQIDLNMIENRKRLDEIARVLADNSAVNRAQITVDAAQKKLSPLRTKLRDLELEIQSNTQKSKSSEQRLYSGNVKNPKELQDLQQEIASLKRRNTELEDKMLELMLSIEDAESTLNEAEETLSSAVASFEAQNVDLIREQTQLKHENETYQSQRDGKIKQADAKHLKLYETMRVKKANKPISILQDKSCGVCGIEQTMNVVQDVLRHQDIIYCTNCGRILVDSRQLKGN
ncbi:MAG: hypothetical protein RLP44_25965 [Aggregatilineales bacterium]